jgi:hypothetical protein
MRKRGPAAAALGLVMALAASAGAREPTAAGDQSSLAAVPADTPIVVQLRGFERVKERAAATIRTAAPDLGPMIIMQLDQHLKSVLQGRDLKGAAKDGPIFIAFPTLDKLAEGGDEAAPAVLVRVNNYAAFRDGIFTEEERKSIQRDPAGYEMATVGDKTVCLLDRKPFAVLTPNRSLATAYARAGRSDKGLAGKLSKAVAGRLLDSDVAAYVDLAAVNKQFGDQIKAFRQLMEFAMQQAEAAGTPGLDKTQIEQAKNVFNVLFQIIDDGTALIAAADFRPQGLALHLETRFGAETKTNQSLLKLKPGKLDEVGTLPAGDMIYAQTEMDENTTKLLGGLANQLGGAGGEAMLKTLGDLQAAGPQGSISAVSFPTAGITVARFRDPARAVAATTKMFQALEADSTFQNLVLKGKPEFRADAEKHRGFTLNHVTVRYDIDKMLEKQVPDENMRAAMKDAMKKLLGESVQTWYGTDGKVVVTLTGTDWASARQRLDDYLDGKSIAKDASYQQVRRELPAEESMIALIDAPRFAVTMGEYITTMLKGMPVPFPVPTLKPVKPGAPAFIGMTLTLRPEEGSVDLFLPGSSVHAVRKAIEKAISQPD